MLIGIHILIALSSFAFTTYLFVSPSRQKFVINYTLIAATLGTGTYLVANTGAPMLQSCVSGLMYITTVTAGSVLAHLRFRSHPNR